MDRGAPCPLLRGLRNGARQIELGAGGVLKLLASLLDLRTLESL